MTIQEFKTEATNKLKAFSPSPALDIQVLLEKAFSYDRTQLLLNRNETIPQEKEDWLKSAVEKRKTGLPIAYITRHKEFYGYDFLVTPSVLIPKPDTEILVARAIEVIIEKMDNNPNKLLTICDMCTGSGCIALAVLRTLTDLYKIPYEKLPSFTLVDISAAALDIAKKNAEILTSDFSDKLHFIRSNLFDNFSKVGGWTFDVILTNPPYIPHSMVNELLKDGRMEPRLALDGDVTLTGDAAYTIDGELADDGLEIIRNLIPQAKAHLSPMGIILMETGEYNAKATASIAEDHGFKTKIHKDLEDQLRVVEFF